MLAGQQSSAADPVVMSRLIANSLLNEIRSRDHVESLSFLSVVNMLRLLDVFSDRLADIPESSGIIERESFTDSNEMHQAQSRRRLRAAVEQAHEAIAPAVPVNEFVDGARSMLSRLLSVDSTRVQIDEAAEAERFLRELAEALARV